MRVLFSRLRLQVRLRDMVTGMFLTFPGLLAVSQLNYPDTEKFSMKRSKRDQDGDRSVLCRQQWRMLDCLQGTKRHDSFLHR